MRVYEMAKKYGIKTKELLRILDENGIYNKTYQSNITEEEIQKAQLENTKEDIGLDIEPIEINSKDYYDVNSELVQVYPDANYYIAISPRGVGKSTNGLLLAIKTFVDENCPSVLIRRRDIELDGGKFRQVFGEIEAMGYIKYWTQGQYNSVHTIGPRAYLCKRDDEGKITDKAKDFFCYAVSLNTSMNIKGIQLNRAEDNIFVKYIIFDELMPVDNSYLPREDELFFNTLSTIIRHFNVAKIILLGNTIVTSLNPILDMMGIDLYSLKIGEKRLYEYSDDTGETNGVAIHMIDKKQYKGVSSKNNKYYIFGNKKLSQITGDGDEEYGVWELNKDFNAKPRDYKKSDIIFKFFWIYGGEIYQGDIIELKDCIFIYNHKTKKKLSDQWLDEDNELIFSTIFDPRPNWVNKICGSKIKIVSKISEIINSGKVYYQNAWLSTYFQNLIKDL